jgi:hypothetical protein
VGIQVVNTELEAGTPVPWVWQVEWVLEGGVHVAKPWVPPVADDPADKLLSLTELKLLTDCVGFLRG